MSGKGTLKNFKTMLGEARLPEKVVQVCLRGDLAADFEAAERELSDAQASRGDSLDAGAEVAEIADRLDGLRQQMLKHTYAFRLRALPKREFRALVAEHPPRQLDEERDGSIIHPDDRGFDLNTSTFFDALVRRCLVDPEMSGDDWQLLDEKLTDNQFQTLALAAWWANKADVDIPFSSAASKIKRSTATG